MCCAIIAQESTFWQNCHFFGTTFFCPCFNLSWSIKKVQIVDSWPTAYVWAYLGWLWLPEALFHNGSRGFNRCLNKVGEQSSIQVQSIQKATYLWDNDARIQDNITKEMYVLANFWIYFSVWPFVRALFTKRVQKRAQSNTATLRYEIQRVLAN